MLACPFNNDAMPPNVISNNVKDKEEVRSITLKKEKKSNSI